MKAEKLLEKIKKIKEFGSQADIGTVPNNLGAVIEPYTDKENLLKKKNNITKSTEV